MMGLHPSPSELFHCSVNLDQRVRAVYPLLRVARAVDFSLVRAEDAKIEAVTLAQVKAAAQKYLKPDALVIAVVKPEER
jgi:hypothetical protein